MTDSTTTEKPDYLYFAWRIRQVIAVLHYDNPHLLGAASRKLQAYGAGQPTLLEEVEELPDLLVELTEYAMSLLDLAERHIEINRAGSYAWRSASTSRELANDVASSMSAVLFAMTVFLARRKDKDVLSKLIRRGHDMDREIRAAVTKIHELYKGIEEE